MLYLFACWHVLMPGHGKSLLVAVCVSGGRRTRLLPLAAGYSLSHGLLMALAAVAGLLLAGRLGALVSLHGLWLKNLYLPVLLFFGLYFAARAWRIGRGGGTGRGGGDAGREPFVRRRPFLTGLGIGLIPCSDVLGFAAISPMLLETHHNLLLAGTVVWLGVATMVLAIAAGLLALPARGVARRIPDWLAYGGSALICFVVVLYRGWTLWQDYLSLYR
jgi:ABC-type nickel/cobalt efflux system permease component RcnA